MAACGLDRCPTEGEGRRTGRRQDGGVLRRTWRLARGYYASDERTAAWALTAGVIGLKLLQIGIQVRFNLWHRDFFDALEDRDREAFFGHLGLFVALVGGSMTTAVAELYVG